MTDLAKTIAAACLDHIQARPDTPEVDELAEVVRRILEADAEPFSLAPDDLYAAALKDLYGVDPSTDTVTIAPDGTSNDPNYAKTGHISDPTIWGLPPHPSTQELYDARRVPFDAFIYEPEGYEKGETCGRDGCKGIMRKSLWAGRYESTECNVCRHPVHPQMLRFVRGHDDDDPTPKTPEAGDGE